MKSLSWLCLVILFVLPISISKGQSSDFKITADPYQFESGVFKQWDNDMVRIGITTKERGLIFKITISNPHQTDSVAIENLRVDTNVRYGDAQSSTFFEQISVSYIYLPPKKDYHIFIPTEFNRAEVIGSYTAELTYVKGSSVEQHIEPYPFQFRVVSEEQFAKEKEQKQTGPVIIIGPWEVKVFDFGGGITITIIGLALIVYVYRKRKRVE